MVSGRGGYREGAGRKKKAEAYNGEATTAARIPVSVAEPLLTLLENGKRVTVLDADGQSAPNPEVERLEAEITNLRQREAELVEQTDRLLKTNHEQENQLDQLKEQLVRLKDERQQLALQIEAWHQTQRQPNLPGLNPASVRSAITTLLEALSIPANQSNKAKIAAALQLLGAQIPEGKARSKRKN
jgi:septal ring factor EnvC (AmiA/AmiB activator)